MERYSHQTRKDAHAAPVLVVGDQLKWLRWALRDFREVKYVDLFDSAEQHPLVLSPGGVEPKLGEMYSGQDMAVKSAWQPAGLSGQPLAKWLLYRKPPAPAQTEGVILWVERAVPEK